MTFAKDSYKKAIEEGSRDAFTRLGYIQIYENKTERHLKNGFIYSMRNVIPNSFNI